MKAAAAYTGLSAKHIRRAVGAGELACSNAGGPRRATYRIARKDLDAWLESRRLKVGPAKTRRDGLARKHFPRPVSPPPPDTP